MGMAFEPITVTLSTFEKLEILRGELKAREEELQNVERELKNALRMLATHRYLKGVSPYYARRPTPPEAAAVPEIEKRRQALYQVIQAIRAEVPRLEAAAAGRQPPPPRAARRRNRFE
jgi:hypothetical protein